MPSATNVRTDEEKKLEPISYEQIQEKYGLKNLDTLTSQIGTQTEKAAQLSRQVIERLKEIKTLQGSTDEEKAKRILESLLSTVRDQDKQEEKDLAVTMESLFKIIEDMGLSVEELKKPSTEETAIKELARSNLENLKKSFENKISIANTELEKAQGWWFTLLGFKAKRIERAQKALEELQDKQKADLKEAEEKIKLADQEAQAMFRARIRNASREQSLELLQHQVKSSISILEKRLGEVVQDKEIISNLKTEAFKEKTAASDKRAKFEELIKAKIVTLSQEEKKLLQMVKNSAEHAAQEEIVSRTRMELEDLNSQHNGIFTKFQAMESRAAICEIMEKSFFTLQSALTMWITRLSEDTKTRVDTYRALITQIKTAKDQELSSILNTITQRLDIITAEQSAAILRAADDAVTQMIESHPENAREIAVINKIADQAMAEIDQRRQKVVERTKKGDYQNTDAYSDRLIANLKKIKLPNEQSSTNSSNP